MIGNSDLQAAASVRLKVKVYLLFPDVIEGEY
jgi:hypothetical protein